jgi:hypothetical protein
MGKLTIQFIPYNEIDNLNSGERIKKLLKVVLENKIIVLQGKLKPEEEARLIEDTMALIGHIKGFKGVELAVLSPRTRNSMMTGFKSNISKFLVGDRESITLIGPATIVREMKKDPSKIELMIKGK